MPGGVLSLWSNRAQNGHACARVFTIEYGDDLFLNVVFGQYAFYEKNSTGLGSWGIGVFGFGVVVSDRAVAGFSSSRARETKRGTRS